MPCHLLRLTGGIGLLRSGDSKFGRRLGNAAVLTSIPGLRRFLGVHLRCKLPITTAEVEWAGVIFPQTVLTTRREWYQLPKSK